ncbi:hypothetical protein [Nonomuraea lactucae]|uniref:hypothetical protein n=1 Tax=Nonomuraea lactucae TaxID=2249762 RepID=UPI000DE54378|nr:hypothetical protein [Nonomuraea lactucae]
MSASTEAISRLLSACEAAADEELMALGRLVEGLEWSEETALGAELFEALIRVPLAVYVERVAPDASLDDVLAVFAEVRRHG